MKFVLVVVRVLSTVGDQPVCVRRLECVEVIITVCK